MFVGHYGAAFLAKRAEPRAPLWALLLAVMWVDVMWAIFLFAGLERARVDPSLPGFPVDLEHMPYTHSLVATVAWAALGFLVARHAFGWPLGVAVAIGAAVGSHWFHDLPVHRPDLPLVWGEPKLGLGLWNYPTPELALEIAWLLTTVLVLVRSKAVDEPMPPATQSGAGYLVEPFILSRQGGGAPRSVTIRRRRNAPSTRRS